MSIISSQMRTTSNEIQWLVIVAAQHAGDGPGIYILAKQFHGAVATRRTRNKHGIPAGTFAVGQSTGNYNGSSRPPNDEGECGHRSSRSASAALAGSTASNPFLVTSRLA
jgi:hypothetical protein